MPGTYATFGDLYGAGAAASLDQAELVGADNATTAQRATDSNPGVNVVNLLPGLQGTNPLWAIPIILGVVYGAKLLREWNEPEEKFREVKVGLYFVAMVVLANAAGAPLLHGLLRKFHVAFISDYVLNG